MAFKVIFINRKEGGAGKRFSGVASLLLSLFILAGCQPPGSGSLCVEADDWGQYYDKTVIIDPKDRYTNTGITMTAGQPLRMEFGGYVDLCPSTRVINPNPAISTWQDSGQVIGPGDKISLIVQQDGQITALAPGSGTQTYYGGEGLYAYISYTPPSNDRMWAGPYGGGFGPAFFELWDPVTQTGGYSGTAPALGGHLYFRYARSPYIHQGTSQYPTLISNSGEFNERYSPWHGRYKWGSKCDDCKVGGNWVNCYSTGQIQPPNANAEMGDHYKCQEYGNEWSSDIANWINGNPDGYWGENPQDHWVFENDSGKYPNTVKYDRDTGYIIYMSANAACQGNFGRYLQMDVGPTVIPGYKNVVPKDCTSGDLGCQPCSDGYVAKKDTAGVGYCVDANDGTFQTADNPTLTNAAVYDMDSTKSTLPSGFVGRGRYRSVVPASGEVWFEILDRSPPVTYPTDLDNSKKNYYEDNIGSYKVHIRTPKVVQFSEILNLVIKPIKRIIFGSCRAGFNPNNPGADLNLDGLSQVDCEAHTSDVGRLNTDPAIKDQYVTCVAAGVSCVGYVTDSLAAKWKPGITQSMYNAIVTASPIINTIEAMGVLTIIIYGMMFITGLIQKPQTSFIIKVVKISIVMQLISPGSWNFFNTYLFTNFIDGMDELIVDIAGNFMGVVGDANAPTQVGTLNNPFAFIDVTLGKFLSYETWIKILGLLFASPIGFVYIAMILVGMWYFLKAVLKAAILYVFCMLAIALLVILAPIFISFLLFDITKGYFSNWIKNLVNFMFQPILVFLVLSIFNMFVYSAIYTLLHYRVCWKPTFYMHILNLPKIPFFSFFMPDNGHTDYGSVTTSISSATNDPADASGVPVGLFSILIFLIISNLMLKMIDFMADLASHITIGTAETSLSRVAGDKAGSIMSRIGGAAFGGAKQLGSALVNPRAAMQRAGSAIKNAPASAGKAMSNAARGAVGMKKR